jgi:hypothetical protein
MMRAAVDELSTDPAAADSPLTADARAPLRLAAAVWLAASALFIVGESCFQATFMLMRPQRDRDPLDFLRVLPEPSIFTATFWLPMWARMVLMDRILATMTIVAALGWILSCWLLADAEHARLNRTSLWLRIVSTATLLAALAFHFIGYFWLERVSPWMNLLYALDAVLALVVALHLTALARIISDGLLSWLAPKIPWLVGLHLFAVIGEVISRDPESGRRFYLAAKLTAAVYGVCLAVAMGRLRYAMRPAATPAPAENR